MNSVLLSISVNYQEIEMTFSAFVLYINVQMRKMFLLPKDFFLNKLRTG